MSVRADTPIISAIAAFLAAMVAAAPPALACATADFTGRWRLASDRPNESPPRIRCSVSVEADGEITGSSCTHSRLGRIPIRGRFALDGSGSVTGQVTGGNVRLAVVASVSCDDRGRAKVVGTVVPEAGLLRPQIPFRGRRVAVR